MTCHKTLIEDIVQRMLYAGQRLGGIVILIVYMQIVMLYCITAFGRQQIVVNEGLGALGGKLHHHTGWSVGIHIGILTGDIIVLDVHDIEEHITGLCLTGNRTLVAIGDIALGYILTTRLHQLHLNSILDFLNRHLRTTLGCNTVGNGLEQSFVFTLLGTQHGLTDSSHDFLFIKTHNAPVALYNSLYHIIITVFSYNFFL